MDRRDAVKKVVTLFVKNSKNVEIDDNTLLYSSGLLESIEMLELMLELEEQVEIFREDFDFDQHIGQIDSINMICNFFLEQ